MHRTIRAGEAITVEPAPASALAVGDIAFYRTARGVTAHRIAAIDKTGAVYFMRGDTPGSEIEAVEPDWILGKVVAIERGGRSIDPASRNTKMTNFMLQCASRARRRALVMASYLLASLALLLLLCAPAHGAVAVVTSASVGFLGPSPYNWTVINTSSWGCPPSSNNYLMVAISSHHATVTGVQLGTGSNQWTLASMGLSPDPNSGDNHVQVFYGALRTSDCVASQTMTFTLGNEFDGTVPSTGTPFYAGAIVFSGTLGPGAAVTASAPNSTGTAAPYLPDVTVQVTAPGTDGLVFDVLSVDNGQVTVNHGSGQTALWSGFVQATGTDRTLTASATYHAGAASGTIPMREYWTNSGKDGAYYMAGIPMVAGSPTLVKEHSLTATAHPEGTLIEFSTSYEVSSLGFNLYREQNGQRVKLNESLLAGSALFAGPATPLTAGRSHSWWDDQTTGGAASYWVEEVDLSGERTWFGPAVPGAAVQSAVQRDVRRSVSMASLGATRDSGGTPARFLSRLGQEAVPAGAAATASPHPLEQLAQLSDSAANRESQWELAAGPAVKIGIQSEGWYRVGQADLLAAGLDFRTDPRTLQLYVDGVQQPMVVQGEADGRLDPGDAVEFYGVGLDTPWSGTRTYWLRAGRQAGLRVQSQSGWAPAVRPATSFPFTIEWRPRTVYFAALLNGDAENFFGPVLTTEPVSQVLNVAQLYRSAAGAAQLQVSLQGATAGAHQVAIQLNGTTVGTLKFSGQSVGVSTVAIPNKLLQEGANTLTLAAEGGESDVSVVDTVLLTYPRAYVADSGPLRLTAPSGQAVTISGFASAQIRVMDITDPGNVMSMLGTIVRRSAGNYAITIATRGPGTRTLLAFADAQVAQPASIAANRPSSWHAAGLGADMVMVGQAKFLGSLGPLKALRESQGLTVAVVDVEDLYDEFNYGAKSPYALKSFLASAAANWHRKPRFVLLVGEATYDPRDYLGIGLDLVPTKMVDTAFLETPSDDWFADFAGDGVPRMAVGRLPVVTADEATALVNKIVGYEQSRGAGWRNQVLLVTGQNDGENDFEGYTAALKAVLPGYLGVSEISQGSLGAHDQLLNSLNAGVGLVNYFGHGSDQVWAGGLLDSSEAAALTNSPYLPFVVSMTCLNGYFVDDAYGESLATALMKAPAGGAIAVWASSGLTNSTAQAPLDKALMRALYVNPPPALGEAAAAAKRAVSDLDVRRTWILFGDPATKLQ
ncbi:MAG: C25 family cysteine peptidase [Bryobacteraceae bacterium]